LVQLPKSDELLRLGENKDYQAVRQKVSEIETLAEARGNTDESPLVQSLLGKPGVTRELNQRIAAAIPGAQAEEVDTTLGNGSRDSRIDMIADLIKSQTTAQGLQQQANQIQTQINKLNTELKSIAINQGYLVDLQRRYEIAEGCVQGHHCSDPARKYQSLQRLPKCADT